MINRYVYICNVSKCINGVCYIYVKLCNSLILVIKLSHVVAAISYFGATLNTFGGYFEQCSMLPQLPKCKSTVDTIDILSNINCY